MVEPVAEKSHGFKRLSEFLQKNSEIRSLFDEQFEIPYNMGPEPGARVDEANVSSWVYPAVK